MTRYTKDLPGSRVSVRELDSGVRQSGGQKGAHGSEEGEGMSVCIQMSERMDRNVRITCEDADDNNKEN